MGKFFSFLLSLSIIALVGCAAVAGVSARFGGLSASPHSGVSVTGGVSTPPASSPSPQWNIANATANGKILDASAQIGANFCGPIRFKPDGTKLYLVDSNDVFIFQYSLSTPWDLSTATYDNKSFSPIAQDDTISDLYIGNNGTSLYLTTGDITPNSVLQYTLGTPWDISTATYTQAYNVSAQIGVANGLGFKSDGTIFYVSDILANSIVYQYSLSSAWDISTASYTGKSFAFGADSGSSFINPIFQPNGERIIYATGGDNLVWQYDLSTAWDISTANNKVSKAVFPMSSSTAGIAFETDGSVVSISRSDITNKTVNEFSSGR